MTKAFLFLPLLILGCASKPKPGSGVVITAIQFTKGCPVDFTVEIDMETGSYDCLGSISHVTPEQWQAAQDLYYALICANKTHCEPVMTGPPLDRFPPQHGTTIYENVYVPTGPEKFETFPPSGNANNCAAGISGDSEGDLDCPDIPISSGDAK